jgi:hypothetical protein
VSDIDALSRNQASLAAPMLESGGILEPANPGAEEGVFA